jgi:hypothetical protein
MKTIKFFALAAAADFCSRLSSARSHHGRDIYPAPAQAKADLAAALKTAAARTSASCSTLAATGAPTARCWTSTSTTQANRPILEANFVLVDVNIGHMDANLDIAAEVRSAAEQRAYRRSPSSARRAAALQPEKAANSRTCAAWSRLP